MRKGGGGGRGAEQFTNIGGGEKLGYWRDAAGGIDEADTVGERRDLGTPDLPVERGELAIDVGDAHVVEVDQRDGPDATARESFRRPRPDAADADHAGVRRAQPFQRLASIKPRQPAEAVVIIRVVVGNGSRGRGHERKSRRSCELEPGGEKPKVSPFEFG